MTGEDGRSVPQAAGPELYARVHTGTPGDVAFYRALAPGPSDILELGCGHGRILLPLARDGHRVTGLDRDAGALRLAREARARESAEVRERVRLVHADMRDFGLEQRYDWVLVPYNGLYCLTTLADQIACLRAARRHLGSGGRLVFDAYAIDTFHGEADPGDDEPDEDEPVTTVHWRGHAYDVLEHSEWQRDAQRLLVRYRYRPREGGPVYQDRIDHRYLLTHQVPELCAAAGLTVAALLGGFRGETLSPASAHLVCIARAAQGRHAVRPRATFRGRGLSGRDVGR